LHIAAQISSRVNVAHLLDAGAAVDARDDKGRTALHLAAADDNRRHDVSSLLIERGASLTAKDHEGLIPGERNDGTIAGIAALLWLEQIKKLGQKQDTVVLRQLFEAAPEVLTLRDTHGQTLLHRACLEHKPTERLKLLIDAGADIDARNEIGQTPLHLAARAHNHDALRVLLSEGADLGALDNTGTTALDAAVVQLFHLPHGLNTIELIRQAGHPPTVLCAAATGDLNLLHELTGGKIAALNRGYAHERVRPLHAAMLGAQLSIVEWLLAQGVDPKTPTPTSWMFGSDDSSLIFALNRDLVEIAILLIENGADLIPDSSKANNPLHRAIALDRDPKILEALLAHGAKYQRDVAVQQAKDPALKNGPRFLELLEAETPKSAAGH
jgi:ankyrin repeat protein